MNNDDLLADKLVQLTFVAFGAQQKHETLTKRLPRVVFDAANTLLGKVVSTVDRTIGSSLSDEDKLVVGPTVRECALLGLSVFDTRVEFAKQFQDTEFIDISLYDIEETKQRDVTAEEIVVLLLLLWNKGKRSNQ